MDIEEIKKQTEEVLQEIRELNEALSRILEKNEDEINEADCEELRELDNKTFELIHKMGDLARESIERKKIIQEVEQGKKTAPLVPTQDIVEGMTEEKFADLVNGYKELENYHASEECRTFDSRGTQKTIRSILFKYEHKKKVQQQMEEGKEAIYSPAPVEGICGRFEHPPKNPSGSWYDNGDRMITSEKVRLLYETYGLLPTQYKQKMRTGEELIGYNSGNATHDVESKVSFVSYKECELAEKQQIKEFEQKAMELKNSNAEELDKPGRIILEQRSGETLQIEITQRELLDGGILPEELGWKSLEQIKEEQRQAEEQKRAEEERQAKKKKGIVSPESMARAGKGVKNSELMPLEKKGFKEWIKGLIDKFKGKGEK